jgi:hypothetical protein
VTDTVVLTTTDTTKIGGGDEHTIQFRPVLPGNVIIRSTAEHPPTRSGTGLLGRLDLVLPGQTRPVASYTGRLSEGSLLEVTYGAKQTDFATAGNWLCRVNNGTEADIIFDTVISYPSAIPLLHKSATLDVLFLNLLIAEAVAASQLAIHIQSSSMATEEASSITWSASVGDSLPGNWKGQIGYWFQVPDHRVEGDVVIGTATWLVLRILNFDSDPDAPIQATITSSNGVPVLQLFLPLNPEGAKIVGIDSDVDLDQLSIEADIHHPTFTAQVDFYGNGLSATMDLSVSVTVAGVSIPLADYVKSKIQDQINEKLSGLSPTQLRQYVDAFFINLMRLGPQARIETYQIDTNNQTLTVNYSVPDTVHPPPAVEPVHPVIETS